MDVIEADCFMGEYYPRPSPDPTVEEFREEIVGLHTAVTRSPKPSMTIRVMPVRAAALSPVFSGETL